MTLIRQDRGSLAGGLTSQAVRTWLKECQHSYLSRLKVLKRREVSYFMLILLIKGALRIVVARDAAAAAVT